MLDKFKQIYQKYKTIFFPILIAILSLFILFLLYLLERYIIYNIIYYSFYTLIMILKIEHMNIFSLKLETILIDIYLHLIFFRLIILSIIFLQGGFFKKYGLFDFFCSFTDLMCEYASDAIENLKLNNFNKVEFFINKLVKFKLKNIDIKNSNYLQIEENLNNIVEKFENYKNNTDSKEQKIILKNAVNALYNKLINFNEISIIEYLFTFKYTDSLKYMENYMINGYFTSHNVKKINIHNNFDIYLLTPKNISKYNNILTVFCNQNGICCEFYPIYPTNIYYYLYNLNCSIIIWNYKGFGLRKGFTTFGNIDKDVDILSNYIKDNFTKNKIIIHGCSIGGYSSIKLAQKLSSFNDIKDNVVLICDRTFGDIKKIVQSYDYSFILNIIYNIIFPSCFYKYSNIENYLSLPSDKKLILFDEKDDEIKYNPASLVYNLTKKYYNEKVIPCLSKYKEYLTIFENLNNIFENKTEKDFDDISAKFMKKLNKYINNNKLEEFFMYFIIFGYPFNKYKEINIETNSFKETYINIPYIMKNIIEKNKNKINDQLSGFISYINFLFIKFNLNCNLNDNDILKMNYNIDDKKEGLFNLEQSRIDSLKKYFGIVRRIFCGHDGKIDEEDFSFIIKFLKYNKII